MDFEKGFELGKCYRHVSGMESKVIEQVNTKIYGEMLICESGSGSIVLVGKDPFYALNWEEITETEHNLHKKIYECLCDVSGESLEWDLDKILFSKDMLCDIANGDLGDDLNINDDSDDDDDDNKYDTSMTQCDGIPTPYFYDKSMIGTVKFNILKSRPKSDKPELITKFELGKFYRHTTGKDISIICAADTTMFGHTFIAETNIAYNFIAVSMDNASCDNWYEITKAEWLKNFSKE